jgi:hypothetical protein
MIHLCVGLLASPFGGLVRVTAAKTPADEETGWVIFEQFFVSLIAALQ